MIFELFAIAAYRVVIIIKAGRLQGDYKVESGNVSGNAGDSILRDATVKAWITLLQRSKRRKL